MKVGKCGQWLFQRRGKLQIDFVSAALALLRPYYPFSSLWFDRLTDIIGYVVMLQGVGLRIWVIGYRKSGTSGRSREIKSAELITDRGYDYVRNPLYLNNLIIVLGVMIIFFNPWLILVFSDYLLFYYLLIRAEEDYRTRRLGEVYQAYKRSTPRLIPRIWRGKRNAPPRKCNENQFITNNFEQLVIYSIVAFSRFPLCSVILYQKKRHIL